MEEEAFYRRMQLLEEQGNTVKVALEGLAAERAAIASERAAIVAERESLQRLLAHVGPTIERATGDAVNRSLSGVVSTTKNAAAMLKMRANSFLVTALFVAVGTVAVTFAAGWGSVAWQRFQIAQLVDQRAQLTDEIEQMQVNIAELAKKGGRIVLRDCEGRLCIAASKDQRGLGKNDFDEAGGMDYLWVAWTRNDGKTPLVVADGY